MAEKTVRELEQEIAEFTTILRVMAFSPKRIQDPRIYYSNRDIDRLYEAVNAVNKKSHPNLWELGDTLRFSVFMLMQCNGYGNPEVVLQDRARDILGYVRTFKIWRNIHDIEF